MANGKDHLGYLDGWRGLAIGMVLIAHFAPATGIDLGRFGVDLFFVLSGLLMSRILFEQRMPIAAFYRRRVSRILPVLWAYTLVVVLVYWHSHPTELHRVLGVLTFTTSYMSGGAWELGGAPLAQTWSLNVEEHCYMLLALIASIGVLRVRSSTVLFWIAIATVVAMMAYHTFAPTVPTYWLRTECAATGLLASAAYYPIAQRYRAPSCLALLAGGLATTCYLSAAPWEFKAFAAPFLLALAVNHLRSSPAFVIVICEWKPLRLLGTLSYSIYLWQQPFYDHQAHFPHHTAMLFACAVGAASYYLLESPVRAWLNEHWRGHAIIAASAPHSSSTESAAGAR